MDKDTQAIIEKTLAEGLQKEFNTVKQSLSDSIEEKFQNTVKELGLDKANFKHGVFPVAGGENEKLSKKERVVSFMKALYKRDFNVLSKNMSTDSDSDGGFLVPEEFYGELVRLAPQYGIVFDQALRIPMKRDRLPIPTLASSVTSYWVGQSAAGTKSSPKISRPELHVEDLVGITVLTNAMLEDTDINTIDMLLELFAEEFARNVDDQAFNGTGTPFLGILQNTDVETVTMASGQETFAETKLSDLRTLLSKVAKAARGSGAFYMHGDVWALIESLQENSQTVAAFQQQPVLVGNGPSEVQALKPDGYLWKYPVYTSDVLEDTTAVSTKFLTFGSFKRGFALGDRKKMDALLSKEGTIAGESMLETNQQALRLTSRLALELILPGAFANLKTAAS